MCPQWAELGYDTSPPQADDGVDIDEEAAPETGTPSPTPPASPTAQLPSAHVDLEPVNPNPVAYDEAAEFLPLDYTLRKLLKYVTGTDDFKSIDSIKLHVVAREISLQRLCIYMPALRHLNLEGSRLTSLRDLGCGLASLQILNVSHCGLDSLDGTFGISTLRELYASYNKIEDIMPCSNLSHIRKIDLRGNFIQDASYIGFLAVCTHLSELTLAECPVSHIKHYRQEIADSIPSLSILDGEPIKRSENGNAELDSECKSGDEENLSTFQDTENRTNYISEEIELVTVKHLPPRPKTALSISRSPTIEKNRKMRPASADIMGRSKEQHFLQNWTDPSGDASSSLTSGAVLYGNLATALRKRKQRTDAWTEQCTSIVDKVCTEDLEIGKMLDLNLQIKSESPNIDDLDGDTALNWKEDSSDEESETVPSDVSSAFETVKESRLWRERYYAFLEKNRKLWENENNESDEEAYPSCSKMDVPKTVKLQNKIKGRKLK